MFKDVPEEEGQGLLEEEQVAGTASESSNGDPQEGGAGAEVMDQAAELAGERALREELFAQLQRLQADFENFRRRTQKERRELVEFASERLVADLLPVLDDLERALAVTADDQGGGQGLAQGVEMVYRRLMEVLREHGLEPMETVGKEFDPRYHEAVMQEETHEHPDNTVTAEFRPGYLFKGRLLRPAAVKVALNSGTNGGCDREVPDGSNDIKVQGDETSQ